MSVGLLFDTLLLQPLQALLQQVLLFWTGHVPTLGWALIAFSLTINLILTPIYAEMERVEAARWVMYSKVGREVERMRRHYRGRELYFYIRTVHRHYRYSPAFAGLGSGSLLLQMLVFFSAYRYLRDQPQFVGVAFGGIHSLSEPDALLGGINVLPLLMTGLNILSAFLHSTERRQRLQASGLAAMFLMLLYASPAALSLYWTTNNAVSLARNLARRLWERARPFAWRSRVAGLAELE